MRRITIWITATLTVLVLLVAYQLNAGDSGGKTGERPAVEQSTAPSDGAVPDDSGKAAGDTNDQTGKPGENK
jgi:hypothetical protein